MQLRGGHRRVLNSRAACSSGRADEAEKGVLKGQCTYSALSNCASAMVGVEGLGLYTVQISGRRC